MRIVSWGSLLLGFFLSLPLLAQEGDWYRGGEGGIQDCLPRPLSPEAEALKFHFLEWLSEKGLPLDELEDPKPLKGHLYSLTSRDLINFEKHLHPFRVRGLYYHEAFREAFPHLGLEVWRFGYMPIGIFQNPRFQRDFALYLGYRKGWANTEDFYAITPKMVMKLGGKPILDYHNNRVVDFVMAVFPEVDWVPWRFKSLYPEFWKKKANLKSFICWVAQHEGWTTPQQCFQKLTRKRVADHGGSGLFKILSSDNMELKKALCPLLKV